MPFYATPYIYTDVVNTTYTDKPAVVEAPWAHWLFETLQQEGLQSPMFAKEFSDWVRDSPSLGLDIGRVRSLYHWADKVAVDPILGIRLYRRMEQRALGILAPLGWHAPNLREIVNITGRFACLVSGNGDFIVGPSADNSNNQTMTYRPRAHTIPPNRHQSLAVTATVVGSIREIMRRPDSILGLGLPRSLDKTAISKALDCQTFDNGRDHELTIVVNGELLDDPIGGRDERLYLVLLNHAVAREAEVNRYRGLSDDIGTFIRAAGFNKAGITQFCKQQGIHPRELQRTLAAQGLSFRQLRLKETRDMAMSMLLQSDLSVSDIAAHLGYAESASFARACVGWFGRSPSELRKSGLLSGTSQ